MISSAHSGPNAHFNIDFTSTMSVLYCGPNTMKITSIVIEKGVTQAFA